MLEVLEDRQMLSGPWLSSAFGMPSTRPSPTVGAQGPGTNYAGQTPRSIMNRPVEMANDLLINYGSAFDDPSNPVIKSRERRREASGRF